MEVKAEKLQSSRGRGYKVGGNGNYPLNNSPVIKVALTYFCITDYGRPNCYNFLHFVNS